MAYDEVEREFIYRGIVILTLEFDNEITTYFFVKNECPFEFDTLDQAKAFIDGHAEEVGALPLQQPQEGDSEKQGG